MSKDDLVMQRFLESQCADANALAAASDLLSLYPYGNPPHQLYRAAFRCGGLVCRPGGEIGPADHFEVLIRFPDDYLRKANPMEVVTWLGPPNVWHPNIRPPVVCVGHIAPGTRLVDLLYQLHEIITWRKVTMNEFDALNHAACQWARDNTNLFPVDATPLKRRDVSFAVETAREEG